MLSWRCPSAVGWRGIWGWSSVARFGAGRRRRTAAKLGMKFGGDLHDGGGVCCCVEPIYDGIYAFWSKSVQLDDVERKLYGPITRMVCKISEPRYGIDLSVFGASRGFESEVVFPTLQDCVIDVKYVRVEGECELL